MYVAVKGGEKAIDNVHRLLVRKRRGDTALPEPSAEQIRQQMSLVVSRMMTEGLLYDEQLAVLAIEQAAGDPMEAIFLPRVYRTTLPRFTASPPLDTTGMRLQRRISATYRDLSGGQLLGPTFDYTHYLLGFSLFAEGDYLGPEVKRDASPESYSRVFDLLNREGLMTPEYELPSAVPDITREPFDLPTGRAQRLQALVRGDEGLLLALGYSTQRGYDRNHPSAGETHTSACEVRLEPEELGFAVPAGEIEVTEYEIVNQFVGSREELPQLTRGYGLVLGYAERKAMGMALVDRTLRVEEYGEEVVSPARQEEFVLMYCDNAEAGGFASHLKLPYCVNFQSELELIRKLHRPGVVELAQPTVQEKRA